MAIIEKDGRFIDTTPLEPERGQAIEWGWIQVGRDHSIGYTSQIDQDEIIRCLHADAQRELPQETRYELRKRASTNYGRTHGMAWFRTASFDDVADWGSAKPGLHQEGWYFLVGQFTTPLTTLPVAETATKIGDDR